MSDKDDLDDVVLPIRTVLAAGAAADSARAEAEVAKLPRLFRFALLAVTRDVRATLAADAVALAPELAEDVMRWVAQPADAWQAFAARLDDCAATADRPDLRGLADIARFSCMTLDAARHRPDDVARVVACLQEALDRLDPSIVSMAHAGAMQQLVLGWTAILAGQATGTADGLAHGAAMRFGRHAATYIRAAVADEIAQAEREREEEEREREERRQRRMKEEDVRRQAEAQEPAVPEVADGCVLVCPAVNTKANPKMRDMIKGHEHAIGVGLPLVATPDLAEARKMLVFEYPYAERVIDLLLAPLVGRQYVRLPPAVLVGPPGAGKSRLVRRLAEVLGLGLWRTDASRADGASFAGTDKRWYSAEPAHPFLAVSRTRTANPAILIDEIEKAGTRADYGRFWDCLLGFLEAETARAYPDPALQLPLDLSHISYLATANSLAGLPAPVLDRLRVIEMPEPRAGDLDRLLPPVLADVAAEAGVDPRWQESLTGDERALIAGKWAGGSVRRLRAYTAVVVRARERGRSRH